MLVIVGHGPSVIQRSLGSWLDEQTVVRLKHAERPDPQHWGTRTDYVCASAPSFWTDKRRADFPAEAECWVLSEHEVPHGHWREASQEWLLRFKKFRPSFRKPSTGVKAVCCAIEFLNPPEIGLLGFDRVLHPDVATTKWFHEPGKYAYGHDAHAEHQFLMSLGVKLTEL